MASEETEGIFMKKVDRKMYRRLKAAAAEKGEPVYTLLNEAIAAYVGSQSRNPNQGTMTLEEIDNAAYSVIESDGPLNGKWVATANGKLIGSADTRDKALQLMRKEYEPHREKRSAGVHHPPTSRREGVHRRGKGRGMIPHRGTFYSKYRVHYNCTGLCLSGRHE